MASDRTAHVPVMVHEVLEQLDLAPGLTVLDGTVGAGGHSRQILNTLATMEANDSNRLIGLDRDAAMLARAAQVVSGPGVVLKQAGYAELDAVLDELQIDHIDRALLDLGLSSDQLADPVRGFGFESSGPLDMRFDVSSGISAAELLSRADEHELERIFSEYGEEPQAAAVARELVSLRQRGERIARADELADLVVRVVGGRGPGTRGGGRGRKDTPRHQPPLRGSRSHPATRVFQALRIAVNHELQQLDTFLSDVLPRRLRSGGRAVVITFHSLEDRLVKQAFREVNTWQNLTRKPIVPTPSEIRLNPRSRSAKLRVAVRI